MKHQGKIVALTVQRLKQIFIALPIFQAFEFIILMIIVIYLIDLRIEVGDLGGQINDMKSATSNTTDMSQSNVATVIHVVSTQDSKLDKLETENQFLTEKLLAVQNEQSVMDAKLTFIESAARGSVPAAQPARQ